MLGLIKGCIILLSDVNKQEEKNLLNSDSHALPNVLTLIIIDIEGID